KLHGRAYGISRNRVGNVDTALEPPILEENLTHPTRRAIFPRASNATQMDCPPSISPEFSGTNILSKCPGRTDRRSLSRSPEDPHRSLARHPRGRQSQMHRCASSAPIEPFNDD